MWFPTANRIIAPGVSIAILTLLGTGCTGENPVAPDITAPSRVHDLTAGESSMEEGVIELTWTAPGNDGIEGTASVYEVRYSRSEITEDTWNGASTFPGAPRPADPGTRQTMSIRGLPTGTIYHFALRTLDDSANESGVSNDAAGGAAAVLFRDNFEGGLCLDAWTVGGRQAEGVNIADCVHRDGSVKGHLFKSSFTEINIRPATGGFPYSDELTFDFDLEVRVSSAAGFPPAYYGLAGVRFIFTDAGGNSLGHVRYIAATTSFPFTTTTTTDAVALTPGIVSRHSVIAADLLGRITLDDAAIDSVVLLFETYSSTRPSPYVEAELWIDDVRVSVPPREEAGRTRDGPV